METQAEVFTGTVCAWVPQKGWGHVSRVVNEGTFNERVEKFWFHISGYKGNGTEPMVGNKVSFTISTVRGGKHPAIENVTLL
jgi:cold shock CspA family protein